MSHQDPQTEAKFNAFDPIQYIKEIYSAEISSRPADKAIVEWILDKSHSVFAEGKYRGKALLDIGSGPVMYPIITASQWFDEVFLSDISAVNVAHLQKWIHGEPEATEAMKYLMNKFASKDGNGTSWQDKNEQVRRKVKDALKWDVHKPQQLQGTAIDGAKFDFVTACLTMCESSTTIDGYTEVIQIISNMLKPGGHFMICDVMEETWYMVNDEKFSVLCTTEEDIKTAFLKTGFKIEVFDTHDLTVYPNRVNCDAKSLYCIIGKKE